MRKALILSLVVGLVAVAMTAPATAKKKKKKACPAYVGTEEAADAELVKVTDKATEDAPVETTVELPPGIPEASVGHAYLNVQVDSKAKETGLFLRLEFPSYEDLDVFVLNPDGEEAARAAGFNPTPFGPFDGTGNGGHSEMGAEQIDGLATSDCQGYTADLASYMSFGGEMTVKAWLGEIGGGEG